MSTSRQTAAELPADDIMSSSTRRPTTLPSPPGSPIFERALIPLKAARKGSIRDVVRRIFGKRPKTAGTTLTKIRKPPRAGINFRHSHAASLPGILPSISDASEAGAELCAAIPQRTLSAPLRPLQSNAPPPKLPYAVEFPQSARLKPLNLGNSSALKRRATLPSIIPDEATAIQVKSEEDTTHHARTEDMMQHRRSRSADDLRQILDGFSGSRNRNKDIEYWRQHSAASIHHKDPSSTSSDKDEAMETRVSQLEASMNAVHTRLNRLASRANHRTVIIDNSPRDTRPTSPDVALCNLLEASNRFDEAPETEDTNSEAEEDTVRRVDVHQSSVPSVAIATLHRSLENEREERRALEGKVLDLQQTISDMQIQLAQILDAVVQPQYHAHLAAIPPDPWRRPRYDDHQSMPPMVTYGGMF